MTENLSSVSSPLKTGASLMSVNIRFNTKAGGGWGEDGGGGTVSFL